VTLAVELLARAAVDVRAEELLLEYAEALLADAREGRLAPDACVDSLTRLESHGFAIADAAVRASKIPGEPTQRVAELLAGRVPDLVRRAQVWGELHQWRKQLEALVESCDHADALQRAVEGIIPAAGALDEDKRRFLAENNATARLIFRDLRVLAAIPGESAGVAAREAILRGSPLLESARRLPPRVLEATRGAGAANTINGTIRKLIRENKVGDARDFAKEVGVTSIRVDVECLRCWAQARDRDQIVQLLRKAGKKQGELKAFVVALLAGFRANDSQGRWDEFAREVGGGLNENWDGTPPEMQRMVFSDELVKDWRWIVPKAK
jgi:hypothetical protein